MAHPSDSTEQSNIEMVLHEQLKVKFGTKPQSIKIGEATVAFDAFSEENKNIGEVYCHIGKLKPGNARKVLADILKIEMYAKERGGDWNKYMFFCDCEAQESFLGKTWRSEAIRIFNFHTEVLEISSEHRQLLLAVQQRQKR